VPESDRPTRSVYALASDGMVACLDPDKGDVQWQYNLAKETGTSTQLFSSPAVIVRRDGDSERRRIFFGAALNNAVSGSSARVFCLEDRIDLK
jgi:outer membrane protein assembly factor BamB